MLKSADEIIKPRFVRQIKVSNKRCNIITDIITYFRYGLICGVNYCWNQRHGSNGQLT